MRFEAPPFMMYYTTRFDGPIFGLTNITKYRISVNSTTRSLIVISIDKFDAGNGTYYSVVDNGDIVTIYSLYNTLIFSKF